MKCYECISFADGICRNPQSRRRDVGYFQEACALAEPDINETKDPEKETTMKENETTALRVCKDCGRELPLEEFQKGPHGYMNYCKECFKKRQKAGKQGPKPAGIAEVRKALIKGDIDPKVAEAVAAPSKVQEEIDKRAFRQPAPAKSEPQRPEDSSYLKKYPNFYCDLVRLSSWEIINMAATFFEVLRERGYEVSGTITKKYEI